MSASHPLLNAWRTFSPHKGINILPGDELLLQPYRNKTLVHKTSSFLKYIADPDYGAGNRKLLHLGLIPIPYLGNLASARVFILMLNPGFGELDYFAEDQSPKFKVALTDSLQQRIGPDDFPMVSLNPNFAWSGGHQYWTRKLRNLIAAVRSKTNATWTDALRMLSREIACLELYPYHSQQFGLPTKIRNSLESARLMKSYVHEVLVPKARNGSATLIVTRHSREWNLPAHKNIVIYSAAESRAAHLTLKSKGGRKITEFLGL